MGVKNCQCYCKKKQIDAMVLTVFFTFFQQMDFHVDQYFE